MQVLEVQTIEKESIAALSFHGEKVFHQHEDIRQQLEHATRLGNGYQTKVSIYFHDDEGLKRVVTTIWATGANYICLKGGVWIPISRIQEIKF